MIFSRTLVLLLLGTLSFAVPGTAGTDAAMAFSEMKIYDSSGRPFRTAREDWAGARQRVAANPEWAEFVRSERAAVEAWMARHSDRVEWVAGWTHDFVSPKDGSGLTWTEAVPGEDTDHFSSPSDPWVDITLDLKAAWIRIFREKHAGMMERAARLYRLTGEQQYADWAAGQMDFYADHLLEWEPQRQGARLYWQILTEGVNLVTYANVVRLLDSAVDMERRAAWKEKFFDPEVAAVNEGFPMILNITCWLRSAVAQVALVLNDAEMWREAVDGPFGVRQQVAEGITADYLWFEQSLSYNSYVVRAFASLFVGAGLYGRVEELSDEMEVVQNLMLSTTYLRFPNGVLPNPSDVRGFLTAPDPELFALLVRVFPTPLGLAAAAGRRDWDTLVDPPAPPPANAESLPNVRSRNLAASRMAVLVDGPWQVFFHYGQPPVKSHLQAEVLNFSASYEGVDVTHDPGTVGYGSPLHSGYYIRGLNHNVPLIDGEGQEQPPKGRRPDPFAETRAGQLLDYSAAPARITVAHPVYRSDVAATRTLEIKDGRLVDYVRVVLAGDDPEARQLGLALHVQGKVLLPESFMADPDFAKSRPESFGYWSEAKSATFTDEARFRVDFGSIILQVTISTPGSFTVWHAVTPDSPPGQREGFYIETTGTAATFTTVFERIPESSQP